MNKEQILKEITDDWAEFNGEMEIVTPDESAVVCNWWLSKLEQIRNEDKKRLVDCLFNKIEQLEYTLDTPQIDFKLKVLDLIKQDEKEL